MKLIIDTINEDLYMALVENDVTRTFAHLKQYKRKSDILPVVFQKLITEIKIKPSEIKEVYVVNGPGSFMGIRAGMTFAKTFTLATGSKLFGINNLVWISGGVDGFYFVDAKGGKSYQGEIKYNEAKVELVDFVENSIINYEDIIKTPKKYLSLFSPVENIPNFEATYFKEPQIGGK